MSSFHYAFHLYLTQHNNQWEGAFSFDVGPNANAMDTWLITNIAFEMGTCLQKIRWPAPIQVIKSPCHWGSRESQPTY
jgi:hypothetical protein